VGISKESSEFTLTVSGRDFVVRRIQIPFREGVELETEFEGERIRVSDRQLGEREALRILSELLQRKLVEGRD